MKADPDQDIAGEIRELLENRDREIRLKKLFHLLRLEEEGSHPQAVTETEVVELHGDAPQGEVLPVPTPGLVGQDDVRGGVGLHVLVGFNVGDNTGSCISEHLSPLYVIVVIVTEEEISDGGLGHFSDLSQHCLQTQRLFGMRKL